jgi:hypothetical protein
MLLGETDRPTLLGRPRRRLEDNIKVSVTEILKISDRVYATYGVLTAALLQILVFWDVIPCRVWKS